jgi:hypothetical protein
MQADCVLVTQPSVDFRTFLGLANKVLGRSPAAQADASRRNLSDSEKFLSCLASLRDSHASIGFSPHLLSHVSFSMMIGADDRDMLDILQCCAGMAFVVSDTLARGVQIAVVSGTLGQWQAAVISGCAKCVEPTVRALFNKIYGCFTDAGLNVWPGFTTKSTNDQTFLLLEDHRK